MFLEVSNVIVFVAWAKRINNSLQFLFATLEDNRIQKPKRLIIRTDGWVRSLKPVNDSKLFYIFIWCQILRSETQSLDTFFERSSSVLIFAEHCKRVNTVNTYTKIELVRNDKLSHTGCGRIVLLGGKIISEYPRCTWGNTSILPYPL